MRSFTAAAVAVAVICVSPKHEGESISLAYAFSASPQHARVGYNRPGSEGACSVVRREACLPSLNRNNGRPDGSLYVSGAAIDERPTSTISPGTRKVSTKPYSSIDYEQTGRKKHDLLVNLSGANNKRAVSAADAATLVSGRNSSGKSSMVAKGRSKNPRMLRPKSLSSSSSKIESAVPVSTSKKSTEKLTREEEVEMSKSIRALRSAIRVRDDLTRTMSMETDFGSLPIQPTEAEWAEACGLSVMRLRRVMHEGQEARAKLVSANEGLVRQIAKRHYYAVKRTTGTGGSVGTILTMQDMVQEGNFGLMEAAERFEPQKGFRFSTYASFWVKQRILKSIADYSRTIRLPIHVHSMLNTIYKARKQMEQEIGRSPSMPELAHYLNMPIDKLQAYTDSSRSVLSLEVPVNANAVDDKRTLGDRIASDSPTPEEDAEVESLRRDIRAVVNELGKRERDVLMARFGLDDGNPKTVEETAKQLGISRDRVRTVEARALNKLRHPQRNYKLKEYVGGNAIEEEEMDEYSELTPENIWSF